jgi:DNA-binding transcriptional ArsR family regulator
MARAAAATDVFFAIAEPRRREIIGLLGRGGPRGRAVNELVETMRIAQPAVSKHLGVLRKAGLVSVTKAGQQRLYRLNAEELKPVHDWAQQFEQFWTSQLDRVKERAERKAKELAARRQQQHPPTHEQEPK